MRAITIIFLVFFSGGFIAPVSFSSEHSASNWHEGYWSSLICRECHGKIHEQYEQSMHAKAFDNPVFKAQYFREVVPLVSKNPQLVEEAKGCIGCHAPIAYLKSREHVISEAQVDRDMAGVTCDFCHTLSGYSGQRPGNYNYISTPGTTKLGPFEFESNWHHVYSQFHTQSEFCAVCHNAVNHHGLEIKATYTEWKESKYAEEEIQCQDCHMNVKGFLTAGKALYESGKAARTSLADVSYRSKIYTHRFPGAHSGEQVIGALTMQMVPEKPNVSPGETISIDILIDNSRTGHKMPSGSADLRLLWLEVKAAAGEGNIFALTADGSEYDVAGKGTSGQDPLLDDVPRGSRIYRAVYVDKTGKQTLASYDAVKITFDNRLNAAEVRKESYRFTVPERASGAVTLTATLYYLPYPSAFSSGLGLPGPEAVEIAACSRKMLINY